MKTMALITSAPHSPNHPVEKDEELLREAYYHLMGKDSFHHYQVGPHTTTAQLLDFALLVKKEKIDFLVWATPHAPLGRLCRELRKIFNGEELPAIFLHMPQKAIGLMTSLVENQQQLQGFPLALLSAQGIDLLNQLGEDLKPHLFRLTFPLWPNIFSWQDSRLRLKKRELWGFDRSQTLFLLSSQHLPQSHLLLALEAFWELVEKTNLNAHLLIEGNLSDLPLYHADTHYLPFRFFHAFDETCRRFSPRHQNKIHYMGELNSNELADLWSLVDWGFQLSTAPELAQDQRALWGLASGVPIIMSAWGGHDQLFKKCNLPSWSYIPVKHNQGEWSLDKTRLVGAMAKACVHRYSDEQRRALCLTTQATFSFAAFIQELKRIHSIRPPMFLGKFGELIQSVTQEFRNDPHRAFEQTHTEVIYNELFAEIYAPYLSS